MLPSLRMDTNGRRSLNMLHCTEHLTETATDHPNPSTGSLADRRDDNHFPKEEYLGTMRDDFFSALNYEPIDVLSASQAFFTVEASPASSSRLTAHPFDHQYDQQLTSQQPSPNGGTTLDHTLDQQQLLADQLAVMCRLCLSTQRDLQPIFDTQNCLPDMIMALAAGVQLYAGDALPDQLCMTCVLQLSSSLSFKQQLETADVKLRQYVLEGGYQRGMKLPTSLDGDDAVGAGLDESDAPLHVCGDSDPMQTERLDVSEEAAEAATANSAAIEFAESALLIVNDVLIEHAFVDVHAGDDDDFVKLADPAGGPATLDAMQHLELLDPNAPQMQPLDNARVYDQMPHVLMCADVDNDSESLLQSMADKPKTSVRRQQESAPIDVDREFDEDVEDNDEHDANDDNETEVLEYNESDEPLQFVESNDPDRIGAKARVQPLLKPYVGTAISSTPTAWQCFVCQKEYADATRLRRHLGSAHATIQPQHSCTVCRKSFKLLTELRRHQKRHVHQSTAARTAARHQCADCPHSFNSTADLRVHRSLHGAEQRGFQCAGCTKQCDSLIQLKRHIRIHFEDKPHKCDICGQGFPERGSLTRHMRRHTDEVREKRHQCDDCGKRYFDMHALMVHRRLHTGERPWACTECDKSFIDSRLLNSHMKVHSDKKGHACDVCQRRFTHQSTLTTHMRTHTGDRPYVCPECGKSFIQSSNMLLHMRSHSGERPYACDHCDRQFASSSTLRVHRRSHTGEKPYACRVCDKKFARCYMAAHMRTHTGEKPFACPTCDRRFTTTSQLAQHVRSHTGERRHVCPECGKACSSATYLRKHMQVHVDELGAASTLAAAANELDRNSAAAAVAGAFDAIGLGGLGGVDVDDELTAGILPHIEVLHELTAADAAIAMGDMAVKPMVLATTPVTGMDDDVSDGSFYQVIDPSILRIQQVRSVGGGGERNCDSNKAPTF